MHIGVLCSSFHSPALSAGVLVVYALVAEGAEADCALALPKIRLAALVAHVAGVHDITLSHFAQIWLLASIGSSVILNAHFLVPQSVH